MKKICKNCGKEFECFDKPRKSHHKSSRRRYNSINCSPQCSKEWFYKITRKQI